MLGRKRELKGKFLIYFVPPVSSTISECICITVYTLCTVACLVTRM